MTMKEARGIINQEMISDFLKRNGIDFHTCNTMVEAKELVKLKK